MRQGKKSGCNIHADDVAQRCMVKHGIDGDRSRAARRGVNGEICTAVSFGFSDFGCGEKEWEKRNEHGARTGRMFSRDVAHELRSWGSG